MQQNERVVGSMSMSLIELSIVDASSGCDGVHGDGDVDLLLKTSYR